jgi:hypothetical protein
LRKFFNYIAGIDLDTRISWIVDALADLFNSVAIVQAVDDILKTEFNNLHLMKNVSPAMDVAAFPIARPLP